MTIETDYLIAGTGPAALFHQLHLRKQSKVVCNIGTGMYGQLSPDAIPQNGEKVHILPIFPVFGSDLWKQLDVDFSNVSELTLKKINHNGSKKPTDYDENSYTEYLTQINGDTNIPFILSYKQFGDIIYHEELSELKKKVKRNYRSGDPRFTKVGFDEGLSLYYRFLKKNEPYSILPHKIKKIDVENRVVYAETVNIQYENLIYCLPLPTFFKLSAVRRNFDLVYSDALFYTYTCTDPQLQPNTLYYDCNINSNIYRAFIPKENVLAVQVARNSWSKTPSDIARELTSLLNLQSPPKRIDTHRYKKCYPLDVTDRKAKENLIKSLKEKNIYLSGRFGTWSYIDLHEVDYELFEG